MIDPLPLMANFPLSSRPNPHSRRHADRPSLAGQRRKRAPPRKPIVPHHTRCTLPLASLDHVYVVTVYRVDQAFSYVSLFILSY